MKGLSLPVWVAGGVAVAILGVWLGDVPNRYQAAKSHTAGQVAELARDWTPALAAFKRATGFRPTDTGYAFDYDNAQARWLEMVRGKIDGLDPEQAYAYLTGDPATVSKLLIDPNASEFTNLLRSVSARVAGDTLGRLSRAVSLAERDQFPEAYREIDLARPYAGLVPAFESQVNRVRVTEVDHGIVTARVLAGKGDFKDAYRALDAVKEHSGLEPRYGAAVLGVREDEVRWDIGVALTASRTGDFEGAQAQLSALGAKGLLPAELAAAGNRVRAEAQFSSIKSLAEAVLKGDAADTQRVMDRYSRLTGFHFSCQPRTLIEERDLGRFLTALEDLRIKPKGGEIRTGWLDLDLVESLGNRFTSQAEVSTYLGEGFRSYALQLADRSRPGFALYLIGCAEREGVEPDPAVTRRLLAALGEAFTFTIYLPPTVTTATHPGALATAPRETAKAILERTVGSWIRISDSALPPSLAGLVISTRLANIKVADSTQNETRTVRYQSGWDQVPNPDYAAVAQQLRQAQQNLNQVAAQDAANQQLAQSAVNSGGLNAFGAALAGAGAGLSRAALNAAQQNVNDWNVRLQSTPPTVQNAVYADEPYEATTHTISYDASFSATIEVGGSPHSDPVTWTSNYSYNTVEIVGNAAHNVPVQAATYVPMESVVQTLSDSLTRKLSDGSDALIARLVGATQDVLDQELQMARVSEEASEDARWGLLALWKTSGAAVDQDRAKVLEAAIRRSLGLNPSAGPAAPAPLPAVTVASEPTPHPEAAPAALAEPPPAPPPAQAPPPVPASAAAKSDTLQAAPAGAGQHGFIGVQLRELTPELVARLGSNSGALVAGTSPGGPAEKAGLMSGDVITKLNGETIADPRQFVFAVKVLPPGTSVALEFVRDGQTSTTTVQLGVRDAAEQAAAAGSAGQGFIGVELQNLTPELATRSGAGSGAAVVGTVPDGPADRAGLKGGDVITKVDGEAMADMRQFVLAVRDLPPGKVVTVEYVRNGQSATAAVTLGVRPTAVAGSPADGAFALADLDQVPVPLVQAPPDYPSELRRSGISGEVLVEFVIAADGTVRDAVVRKSTSSEFEAPAIAAVNQWRFRPGLKGGREVAVREQVPISFTLGSK